jgi:hypothetical protein
MSGRVLDSAFPLEVWRTSTPIRTVHENNPAAPLSQATVAISTPTEQSQFVTAEARTPRRGRTRSLLVTVREGKVKVPFLHRERAVRLAKIFW